MAIIPRVQEKHPNYLIWILFCSSFVLFVIGAILYGFGTKKLRSDQDSMFNYWPLLDSMLRILPHVVVCVIYRLCRFYSNKSVVLALHVIIAVLAFIGTVFANEHQIWKGSTFSATAWIKVGKIHKIVPKDPVIWIFSTWLEFLYVIMMIYKCCSWFLESLFFQIFIAICIFFLCRANSRWVRSVQEGCHALFGIFLLLSFTIDFVMSLNSRNGSLLVDRGDFADISITFFAMATVIFALVCMFIVVNPYFDWKLYGDDSTYVNVGMAPKGINRSEGEPSDRQGTPRSQSVDEPRSRGLNPRYHRNTL